MPNITNPARFELEGATKEDTAKILYAKAVASGNQNLMAQSTLTDIQKKAIENPAEEQPKVSLSEKDMQLLAAKNFDTLNQMMNGHSNDLAMHR